MRTIYRFTEPGAMGQFPSREIGGHRPYTACSFHHLRQIQAGGVCSFAASTWDDRFTTERSGVASSADGCEGVMWGALVPRFVRDERAKKIAAMMASTAKPKKINEK